MPKVKPKRFRTLSTLSECIVGLPFSSSEINRVPTLHNPATSLCVNFICLRCVRSIAPMAFRSTTSTQLFPIGNKSYQFSNLQYIITDRENTPIENAKYKKYYRSVIFFISLIKPVRGRTSAKTPQLRMYGKNSTVFYT